MRTAWAVVLAAVAAAWTPGSVEAQTPGDFIPVDPRQPDVQQHHVRQVGRRRFQGGRTRVGRPNVVPRTLEQLRKHVGRVLVVIDHQSAWPYVWMSESEAWRSAPSFGA